MEKGISYISRTYNDYKESLMGFTKQYYPELMDQFNDASVGSWIVDLVANVGDNLSYHIDRAYQETNINSAQRKSSLYALARNNGVKIPGPKSSIAEVVFSCELPVNARTSDGMKNPDWSYAPVIKKGTKVGAGRNVFELMEDVDFAEQFNGNGVSNRSIVPNRNSNNIITSYTVTKTGMVSAGETKIFSKVITEAEDVPFYSITIPDTEVTNVESIIFQNGSNYQSVPTNCVFNIQKECETVNVVGDNNKTSQQKVYRYFEVDHLSQQYRWGDYLENGATVQYFGENGTGETECYITKGEWIPLRQKFITEFTENGYLKVIFGSGNEQLIAPGSGASAEAKYLMSHLINNDGLGLGPKVGHTMFIMYRKGGGAVSNLGVGAIKNIVEGKYVLRGSNGNTKTNVKRSISVNNLTPSVSGKDMPSNEEIRYLIKYHNAAQERCVTLKDYVDRVMKMPARYGCPFRVSASEENNKVMLYFLGVNQDRTLSAELPDILCENLENYLSEYRSINDYVEMKSGRIINLQFEIDLFIDKNYNPSDVIFNVSSKVRDYMDVNGHQMGDDIFVGDIEKEISKIDGVANLIDLRVYNIYSSGYSQDKTCQEIQSNIDCAEESENTSNESGRDMINLKASHKMLYSENDSMFEIKYPDKDIICRPMLR